MLRTTIAGDPSTVPALLLRVGLGVVLLVFGAGKVIDPDAWRMYVPMVVTSWCDSARGLDLARLLLGIGLFECVLGAQLALGFCTRRCALLFGAYLFVVVLTAGGRATVVRDVGLLGSTLALAALGGGALSVDAWLTPATPRVVPAGNSPCHDE